VSSENKNNKDRKEITSTNAVTPTTGNTKEEELTPVIKPETTGINGEIMVITPPLIKYSKVVVVRPSSQEKKEGEYDPISDKAKKTSKSLKQTVSAASKKAKLGNNNVEKDKKVNKTEHSYKQPDREGIGGQDTAAIPVNEERFSISKNTVSEDIKIEKRWISATRKVEVPIPYEEVYVNDKVVKLFDEKDDDNILSKLKDKILDTIDRDKNKQTISQQQQQQNEPGGELIPLFDDKDNNQITEKVIPILGEEVVVSRRTVKIGEIVIKKRRVTDNKKIQIDIKKEKVILEYPDGTTEQITA
jgi:stress response protein YsnF